MDKIIHQFIIIAKRHDLPINFLERITLTHYNFRTGAHHNYVRTCINLFDKLFPNWCSSINVTAMVADDLEYFIRSPLISETIPSISMLYHEYTHAYFFLIQERNPLILKYHPTAPQLIEAGLAYYKKAPLVNGKKANDPERILTEAAASYVENRIAKWLFAYTSLKHLLMKLNNPSHHITTKAANQYLQNTIIKYNELRSYYGYQFSKPSFFEKERQVSTTKPIMPKLKIFLDKNLLEHKIPPSFNSVIKFQNLIKAIKAKPPFATESIK